MVRRALQRQIEAIAAAAKDSTADVWAMAPMISTAPEAHDFSAMLEEAGLKTHGVMVETPSAAVTSRDILHEVDFVSIGTNDLTQYTLAAERGNTSVAALADPLDPAVVTLINRVCRGAGPDRLVAVCGELAADETATDLLVALGVRELSVAPRAVPPIKQAVRGINVTANPRLVERCLEADTAASVRAALT